MTDVVTSDDSSGIEKRNAFEGGTVGNNITVGNSGGASGDAFDEVNVGAGGSAHARYSSVASEGSVAAELAAGTIQPTYLRMDYPSRSQVSVRSRVTVPAPTSGSVGPAFGVYKSGFTSACAALVFGVVSNGLKAYISTPSKSFYGTIPLPTGEWLLGEMDVIHGSGATGSIAWRVYDSDDTLLDSGLIVGANVRIASDQFKVIAYPPSASVVNVDDIALGAALMRAREDTDLAIAVAEVGSAADVQVMSQRVTQGFPPKFVPTIARVTADFPDRGDVAVGVGTAGSVDQQEDI